MRRSDADRVSTHSHETGVAQTDLSGKTHQKIESERSDGENEDQGRDAKIVCRRKQQRQNRYDDDKRYERKQSMPLQSPKSIGAGQHFYTRSTIRFPNRPCGMATSTTRITMKATASL